MKYVFDEPNPTTSADKNQGNPNWLFSLEEILTAQLRAAKLKKDIIAASNIRDVRIPITPLKIPTKSQSPEAKSRSSTPEPIVKSPEIIVNTIKKRRGRPKKEKIQDDSSILHPVIVLDKLKLGELLLESSHNLPFPSDVQAETSLVSVVEDTDDQDSDFSIELNQKPLSKKCKSRSVRNNFVPKNGIRVVAESSLDRKSSPESFNTIEKLPEFLKTIEKQDISPENEDISVILEKTSTKNFTRLKKNYNSKRNSNFSDSFSEDNQRFFDLKSAFNGNIWENYKFGNNSFEINASNDVDLDASCAICKENFIREDDEFVERFLCSECRLPYEKWIREPWRFISLKCRCEKTNECRLCRFWSCVNFVRCQNRFKENLARIPRNFHSDEFDSSSTVELEAIDNSDNDRQSRKRKNFGTPVNGYKKRINGYGNLHDKPNGLNSDVKSPDFKTISFRRSKFFVKKSIDLDPESDGNGPKVRYVCRRSSMVLGDGDVSNLDEGNDHFFTLSALPVESKENILKLKRFRKRIVSPVHSFVKKSLDSTLSLKKAVNILNKRPTNKTPKYKKTKRCGECDGCKAENCNVCSCCRDLPANGGPGTMKLVCIERRCTYVIAQRRLACNARKKQRRNTL